jgi:hypothetical protein
VRERNGEERKGDGLSRKRERRKREGGRVSQEEGEEVVEE